MNILRLLKRGKTAKAAKDRLQIIIAQERSQQSQQTDYLPLMRQEILKVIAKYTGVKLQDVKVDLQSNRSNSVLELNITLPENLKAKTPAEEKATETEEEVEAETA